MAAIYDELGNVIGDDGRPSPDEMRYELAKSRDYTAPIKAAIQHMPGAAFVQGVMPIVNFPGQILGSFNLERSSSLITVRPTML